MIPRITPAVGVLAAVAIAFAAAGCGEDQLKGSDVEKTEMQEQGARGYPDIKVDCPDTVDAKVGSTFTCDVKGYAKYTKFEGKIIAKQKYAGVEPNGGYR